MREPGGALTHLWIPQYRVSTIEYRILSGGTHKFLFSTLMFTLILGLSSSLHS